ncbi:hypothetical protein GETHOR_08030 [Geothrix oryzae]|uniref:VWFA domain-containing protein n=1 Tax=Geothrix oryzae TaxID=2927975 RepID=A0ABM8DP47_9BACT|nr:vWA domain-containing protein [Geothrix oryzae]BDU68702.1 hypothetical protein GETHOR_08030 [Geothrix oryzae]
MIGETSTTHGTHTAAISRQNPGCILFLLDQSGSMAGSLSLPDGTAITKEQGVADVVNRLLGELVLSCTKGEEVYDRFHLGVITYGEGVRTASGFEGLVPLSKVASSYVHLDKRSARNPDGTTTDVAFPVWFVPTSGGGTPMCGAIHLAETLLEPWISQHPDSFPPIVFNITDGASTDGSPLPGLLALQAIGTGDGPCLTFNCLLAEDSGPAVVWPAETHQVPNGHLRDLFEGSSILPESMRARAASVHKLALSPGARGVVLNATLMDLVRLLDIGSTPNPGGGR